MPYDVLECPQCKYRNWRQCRICAKVMPRSAKRCNSCQSYRGFRRFLSFSGTILALLTALFSVLGNVIRESSNFVNRHSRTSISFLSADDNVVYVRAENTGRTPSTLGGFWLTFEDQLEIAEVRLVLTAGESRIVRGGSESRLGLEVRGLHPLPGAKLTFDQIKARINNGTATVHVRVEESNGVVNRSHTFEAVEIRDLINNKLSPE